MNEHKHHWLIDEAAGPESQGTCVFCNLTRKFSNIPPPPLWRDTQMTFAAKQGGRV